MSKRINRALALFLAAGCMLSLAGTAFAVDITVTASNAKFAEANGKVAMQIYAKNDTAASITLISVVPETNSALSQVDITGLVEILPGDGKWVPMTGTVKGDKAKGNYGPGGNEVLTLYFSDGSSQLLTETCSDYTIRKTSDVTLPEGQQPTLPEPTPDPEAKLRISPVDKSGQDVAAPAGDYGEKLLVRVPLVCQSSGVYDVKIAPVLSTDIEKFPFDITNVDYLLRYPNSMAPGEVVEFQYALTLSKKATTGVKQVDFNLTYRNRSTDALETAVVSIFVNVKKGLAPATPGESSGSTPKLIVESYTIDPEKIYAGETFDVTITIKNTSAQEAVKNIQIRAKDMAETATLVPGTGGSNTIYISKIGKGESKKETISFQTAPDAVAKAYTLGLDFGYEGDSNNTPYTANESISVRILQEIRLKTDAPVFYDEAWVGQSCAVSAKMYNMGKASVYNCMVNVEGEGLALEESYFGGNLSAGGTLSADIGIIPSVGGEIAGALVITYEDVYGEAGEERLPFTLFVNEEMPMDPSLEGEGMGDIKNEIVGGTPAPAGMPWWGWALAALGTGGAGTGGFMLWRKKRARALEEL
ncbi:MAG: hypothetical protein LBN26_10185 [Christensenellaceae bacterium]|jgi:hypothetical protein|nr:hypothetical protein [Christensenellaceae bacterium]